MSEVKEKGPPTEPEPPSPRDRKNRPSKTLPTDRINFTKQLDILRAYVAASGPSQKAVTNKEVADLVKMAETTTSLANSFFTDVGFLRRAEGGYQPAPEVFSYARAYEWNPEEASQKLQPLISPTWFAGAVIPKASFRTVDEGEAITALAEASSAGPVYRNQLRTLLEYLEAAGLLVRDGTMLRARSAQGQQGGSPVATEQPVVATSPGPRATVASSFNQAPEGTVQFHVSVRVDMGEFSSWEPGRIAAFFSGIAQVLAAKGALEKDDLE